VNAIRVLIIDDDPSLRQTLRSTLQDEEDWELDDRGFDGLDDALSRFRPDLLVLDLLEGGGVDGQATGNESFEEIRRKWFCPVVVYSAFPDRQEFSHSLVKVVTKGANTELEVRDRLRDFVPYAEMIQGVHRDFDARIREALRDSVETLSNQAETTGGGVRGVIVPRAVNRLVAARVDAKVSGGEKLQAWERFIVPPLGNHLLTADLLRLNRADGQVDEGDFRLVLTPSCDLVSRDNSQSVLVARCESLTKLGKVELIPGKNLTSKQKDSVRSIFTEGMVGHLLPIPEFRGHIPMMVANLGHLELIEWEQVELGPGEGDGSPVEGRFQRVASTDSPFREMAVWAYLRVTGRPGLPEIDINGWLENLLRQLAARVDT